jgi:transcriptional regulator NrdR family protein
LRRWKTNSLSQCTILATNSSEITGQPRLIATESGYKTRREVAMMKEKFLTALRKQLHEAFTAAKSGMKVSAEDKYRCEGFMQAGIEMEVVTDDEVAKLINSVHISVYGQSIAERRSMEQGVRLH